MRLENWNLIDEYLSKEDVLERWMWYVEVGS